MNFSRCRCFLFPALLTLALSASAAEPSGDSGAQFSSIAGNAYAGSSVNVVANICHSLFTHGETQYAAYYDADGFMVIAKRALDSSKWETQPTAHRGNVSDAHNSISLAVDGAGFLHVAWDHHVSPLHYARSIAPGSLTLTAPTTMTGKREDQVTYPQFFPLPDGDLLFLYRDGGSGRGRLALNRYSVAAQQWSAVQPNLIDGEGQRSPYWGLGVDATGTLHLAWIWRDSPDVSSNHDLAYARSRDGGVTWTKSDGTACPLPFTSGNCEYATRIPTAHNLMNSPAVVADEEGRPFITTYWSDTPEAAPQFHVVFHDGGAWNVRAISHPLTPFTLAGTATKRPPISRGVLLVASSQGKTAAHLVYRDDSRGGHVVAVSTADLLTNRNWTVKDLTSDSVGSWEPAFDPMQWRHRQTFAALVENVRQLDGNDRSPAVLAPPAPIGVLSWKPAQP